MALISAFLRFGAFLDVMRPLMLVMARSVLFCLRERLRHDTAVSLARVEAIKRAFTTGNAAFGWRRAA
jgi:hypothetical protein